MNGKKHYPNYKDNSIVQMLLTYCIAKVINNRVHGSILLKAQKEIKSFQTKDEGSHPPPFNRSPTKDEVVTNVISMKKKE
jgi:hypothetical protein